MELANGWREKNNFIFRLNVKNLESLSATPKLPLITQTNESKERKQLSRIITHEVARAGWLISFQKGRRQTMVFLLVSHASEAKASTAKGDQKATICNRGMDQQMRSARESSCAAINTMMSVLGVARKA